MTALGACRECRRTKRLTERGFCRACYLMVRAAEARGERGCETCGATPVVRAGGCASCHRPRRAGGACAVCGTLVKRLHREGRCGRCDWKRRRHPCNTCSELIPARRARCVACSRGPKVAAWQRQQLVPFEHLFAGHMDLLRMVEHWKTLGAAAPYTWARSNEDLLRAAARGDVDHETLNRLPFPRTAITNLRFHLENAGVLEPLALNVDLFAERVADATAGLAAAD